MCVFVWHRGVPQGWEGSWVVPHTLSRRYIKGMIVASGALAMHISENFINKLCRAPLIKWGWVTFLVPKSVSGRTWAPCPIGMHYVGALSKIKVVWEPWSLNIKGSL